MGYIYIILYVHTVTTCLTERYRNLHVHTTVFINFNMENSIFYTPSKYTFLQNIVLPPFYCAYCAYIYNII